MPDFPPHDSPPSIAPVAYPVPFPAHATNPAMDECAAAMWRWADDFGLCPTSAAREQMHRTRPELWTATYWPHTSPQLLTVLAQWMFWAFAVDDMFDDNHAQWTPPRCAATVARLTQVLDAERPSGVYEAALADLWPRLAAGRSAWWCRRFRRDASDWLWTYHAEAVDRAAGTLPSFAAYRLHRVSGVAIKTFLDLCEVACGIDLPDSVHNLPCITAMRHYVADYIGLHNDVESFAKEWRSGYHHNAVWLHHHHIGCSWQAATESVTALLHEDIAHIQAAQNDLRAQLDGAGIPALDQRATHTCVRAYTTLLRADIDMHVDRSRYRVDDTERNGP
jgi:(+)-beta-caryophyllene/(+)-caryolan-1-ol synthase